MIELVNKVTRSYSNCIPRAQEARIKIKHATQRHEDTFKKKRKKPELTEIKPIMSVIKNTLDGINGISDIKE